MPSKEGQRFALFVHCPQCGKTIFSAKIEDPVSRAVAITTANAHSLASVTPLITTGAEILSPHTPEISFRKRLEEVPIKDNQELTLCYDLVGLYPPDMNPRVPSRLQVVTRFDPKELTDWAARRYVLDLPANGKSGPIALNSAMDISRYRLFISGH